MVSLTRRSARRRKAESKAVADREDGKKQEGRQKEDPRDTESDAAGADADGDGESPSGGTSDGRDAKDGKKPQKEAADRDGTVQYLKPPVVPAADFMYRSGQRVPFRHPAVRSCLWDSTLAKMGWTTRMINRTHRRYFAPHEPYYCFDSIVKLVSYLCHDRESYGAMPEIQSAILQLQRHLDAENEEQSDTNSRSDDGSESGRRNRLQTSSNASAAAEGHDGAVTSTPSRGRKRTAAETTTSLRKSERSRKRRQSADGSLHDRDVGPHKDNDDDDRDNGNRRTSSRKRRQVARFSTTQFEEIPKKASKVDLDLFLTHLWPVLQSTFDWKFEYYDKADIDSSDSDSDDPNDDDGGGFLLLVKQKYYVAGRPKNRKFTSCRHALHFVCNDYDHRQNYDVQQALLKYERILEERRQKEQQQLQQHGTVSANSTGRKASATAVPTSSDSASSRPRTPRKATSQAAMTKSQLPEQTSYNYAKLAAQNPNRARRPHKFQNPVMQATVWKTLTDLGWKTTSRSIMGGTKRFYYTPKRDLTLQSITHVLQHVRTEEPWKSNADVQSAMRDYERGIGFKF